MLKNKTVFITGASRGIGKAIALEMAKNGANVALNDFNQKDEAEEVKKLILKMGVRCEAYDFDVSDFKASKEMIDKVLKDFGQVDVLVNNAGVEIHNSIIRMSEQEFDKVIAVNLKGCWNMIKHLFPHFSKQRSGTIINMASVCGVSGWPGQSNYSATKGGLIAMTHTVAKELASRGVTCNAIAPGYIETAMTEGVKGEHRDALLAKIPLGRGGTPEDIAHVTVFLAGPGASYITGETIRVDGGMLCV